MAFIIDWIRRRLVGPTLLEDISLLPLESSLEDAIAQYGPPADSHFDEEFPEAQQHTFRISDYHTAVAWQWNSRIHAIVYFSANGDAELDLETMVKNYGNGQDWSTVTEGYLYRRADGTIRLWCSVLPAIGVGTEQYFKAETEFKMSRKTQSEAEMPTEQRDAPESSS